MVDNKNKKQPITQSTHQESIMRYSISPTGGIYFDGHLVGAYLKNFNCIDIFNVASLSRVYSIEQALRILNGDERSAKGALSKSAFSNHTDVSGSN